MKLKIVKEKEKVTNDWSIERVANEYTPYNWEAVFESAKNELKDISDILEEDRPNGRRLPNNCDLFRIFHMVPLHKVRVVVLGQDPYFSVLADGTPQATGMAFSVPRNAPIPSSLKNIYKELKNTVAGFVMPNHGDLTCWALHQGIFLLNTCLTVRQGEAGSHKQLFDGFIKKVITAILDKNPKTIFVLWGKQAENTIKKMVGSRATTLVAAHPSGLSCKN